jgi:membrane-associated protein
MAAMAGFDPLQCCLYFAHHYQGKLSVLDWLPQLIDVVVHLDEHLSMFVSQYGSWVYALLFLIIFCETGLVVTPFLPGDSLLFVAGAISGSGAMEPLRLMAVLWSAAVLGDNVNYAIGRFLGPRLLRKPDARVLKKEYLDRTQAFYARHGGKTLVLARFLPIVRTFAPFVAGVGAMRYARFLAFSIGGGVLWVGGLVGAGYLFGNLPWVKDNLTLVILAIIALSLTPGMVGYLKSRSGSPA